MPSSHIALHTEWQHMLHSFSAKARLAGPLYICASNVPTQSIIQAVFCLLLLSPTQLTPPSTPYPPPWLVSLLRSRWDLAGFLCGDGRAARLKPRISSGSPFKRGWALPPWPHLPRQSSPVGFHDRHFISDSHFHSWLYSVWNSPLLLHPAIFTSGWGFDMIHELHLLVFSSTCSHLLPNLLHLTFFSFSF